MISFYFDDLIKLKYTIHQIIYNIDVINNELDYFEDRHYLFFNDILSKIKSDTNDNIKYYYYEHLKYFRICNILYMQDNFYIYYKHNNVYYKKSINSIEFSEQIDESNTFISLNDKLFKTNNVILILEGIVNLINYMVVNFQYFIKHDDHNIIFINNKNIPYKIINISFLFYRDNNKFNLKDIYEFLSDDIITIHIFGNFLKYIYYEFKYIKIQYI